MSTTAPGFLSNLPRFPSISPSTNKFPGPGSYSFPTPLNDSFQNISNNEASFFSKATRFPPLYKNTGPGPGAYHKSFTVVNSEILDKARAKTRLSPVFYKESSRNRFTKHTENPGPGVYEPKNKRKHIPAAKYVFESTVKRLEETDKNVPGPGVYEIKRAFEGKKVRNSTKSSAKQSQELWERNMIEKIKEWAKENSKSEGGNLCKKDLQKKLRRVYVGKPQRNELIRKISDIGENKHVLGEFLTKKEQKEIFPGPGSYFVMKTVEKQAVSAAVFKSESQRNTTHSEFMENLGPGRYGPLPLRKKKNFHYNGYGKWI